MPKTIYLDHAAATPIDPRVLEAMLPFMKEKYGNPSSIHHLGLSAREALEQSRLSVAKILNATSSEIIFTSSGTESINLAIQGITKASGKEKPHIITSSIEHHAVLNTCKAIKSQDISVTYIKTDKFGKIAPADVESAINPNTVLVSIMYANNEIGTIQSIKEIGRICKQHNILFHTDACQAGSLELNVNNLNVDLLSLNGSKIYGPKGVGCLYIRRSLKLKPIIFGGNQEYGLRSGTENVAAIVGFAKAIALVQSEKEKNELHIKELRDFLQKKLLSIPNSKLNGHPIDRLAGNLSITFENIEGESVVMLLDREGICASTGAACSRHDVEPSHVLLAIGLSRKEALSTLRFTLGKENTKEEIDNASIVIDKVIKKLRR